MAPGEFLAAAGRGASATQGQALNALVFLHREVFGLPLSDPSGIVRPKRSACLPVVQIPGEVSRLLEDLKGTPRLGA